MYGLNALLEFNHSPKCLVVAPVLTVSIMFFYAYAALLHSNKAFKMVSRYSRVQEST